MKTPKPSAKAPAKTRAKAPAKTTAKRAPKKRAPAPRAKRAEAPAPPPPLPQWKQRARASAAEVATRGETELAQFYGAHLLEAHELHAANECNATRADTLAPYAPADEALPDKRATLSATAKVDAEIAKRGAKVAPEVAGIRGYVAPQFPRNATRIGSASALISGARVIHFPRGQSAREVAKVLARKSRHDKAAEARGATVKRAAKVKPWTNEKTTRHTKARAAKAADIRAARKAARVAGIASYVTARFHTNGSAKRDESGAIIEIRDGTGRPIEFQGMEEMHAEARAAFIASGGDFKKAANAAQKTLRRALREPAYDSAEKATRARDRQFRRARDAWEGLECTPNDKQPHAAEFMMDAPNETYLPPRTIMARQLRRAKAALRAHYARRDYPRARADLRRDLATIRALAREIASGEFSPLKWAEDTARAQRFNDLAKRAQSGFAALAIVPRITITGLPARAPEAAPQRFTLFPLRGEARDILNAPATRRALGRARASAAEVATLADWTPLMA